jgi:hypothetical protein
MMDYFSLQKSSETFQATSFKPIEADLKDPKNDEQKEKRVLLSFLLDQKLPTDSSVSQKSV